MNNKSITPKSAFVKYLHNIIILILFFLTNGIPVNSYAQQPGRFSEEDIKSDLKYLRDTLECSHYNLYLHTKKEVFDKEYERISGSITDSLSPLQINRLFVRFVALAKDGHCTLPDMPWSFYFGSYIQSGGTVFPLNVYFREQQVFVLDNFSSDTSIVPGDEIVSINGKPVIDELKNLYDYICSDNEYSRNSWIEAVTFPRAYWMVNGEKKSYEIGIRKNDGRQANYHISAIPAGLFESKISQKKPLLNQTRNFHFIDNVAYLKPGVFYNPSKGGNTGLNIAMLDNKEFVQFLDSCFILIHNKNTHDLIIDLRDNPGGASTFSNPLVAFFATEPFIAGGEKVLLRASEFSKEFWKDYNDTSELFLDIKKEMLSRENGSRFEIPTSKYKYPPRTDSLRFQGHVYVLINRFSASQAVEVSAMIKHYGFGKLVGERTSPLASANARQFKLPKTQITVYYSEAYYEDTSMANGVTPDYLVSDDPLTDKDEILDYTLTLIKEGKY